MSRFTGLKAVYKREFSSYFATPMGYILLVIFLVASGYLTVARDYGQLMELRQASLFGFFEFIPAIFVILVPAVAMRLWAEERKTGTIELLFTLPITLEGSYLGKFLAGWSFLLVGLFLTFPIPLVIAYLGDPDWGTIFTGYIGCALLSAALLSVGMFFSALSKNQVVSFILAIAASVAFLLLGLPQTIEIIGRIAGGYFEQLATSLSLMDQFSTWTRGLVEPRSFFFFLAISAGWLFGGMTTLNQLKAS